MTREEPGVAAQRQHLTPPPGTDSLGPYVDDGRVQRLADRPGYQVLTAGTSLYVVYSAAGWCLSRTPDAGDHSGDTIAGYATAVDALATVLTIARAAA